MQLLSYKKLKRKWHNVP